MIPLLEVTANPVPQLVKKKKKLKKGLDSTSFRGLAGSKPFAGCSRGRALVEPTSLISRGWTEKTNHGFVPNSLIHTLMREESYGLLDLNSGLDLLWESIGQTLRGPSNGRTIRPNV